MRRNCKLVWMLIKMRLSHMMMFRLNFFSAAFVDTTVFAVELLAFSAIYANVDAIGGWTRAEMIIFIGTFSLINALNMVIFFFGVIQLPQKIISGDLDHYLTKPMNPLLRLTFEQVNVGSLPLIVGSILVIAYGVFSLPVSPTAGQIAGYIMLTLLMTVLWYDMEVILRCIPFFVMSASDTAGELEGSFITLCFRIPGTLFKGVYKVIFYFVLPYGIMSTIPTQMLSGMLTPLGFAYGVGVVVLFSAFTRWFWRLGLKHYKSASS